MTVDREAADREVVDRAGTAEPERAPADRVFGALTMVVLAIAAATIFFRLNQPISDPDTFWHLRLGEYLLSTGNFVGSEPWSSLAERQLVLHEWPMEVVFFATYSLGGWEALSWMQGALGLAFLASVYVAARRFAPPILAGPLTLAAFVGASPSLSLRPQVISFALIAVTTAAWISTTVDRRPRWWLVALTWVWAAVHGMWVIGPAIGVAVIVGMMMDKRVSVRTALRYTGIPVLSVCAAALTPVGPRLLSTAWHMREYTSGVQEWGPASVLQLQVVMALLVGLGILLTWLRRGGADWSLIALWVVGVGLSVAYVRTTAVGATVLCVLAASVLGPLLPTDTRRAPGRRLEVTILAGSAAVILLLGSVLGAGRDQPADVPTGLSPALAKLPDDSVVYNEYRLGGWLLWAHPHLDPVIDGRADVYSVEHFDRTATSFSVPARWPDVVRDSRASVALLRDGSPLAEALVAQSGWSRRATDAGYVLLVAPGGSPG